MQMQPSDENFVCPSVCQTVDCDKMEERSVQIFTTYERSFSVVFWEEWCVEQTLVPEILGQTDRVGAKSPIFYLFSLVAPQQ